MAELAGAHDLGADIRIVLPDENVVDAGAAAAWIPPASGEHPFVQPLAGVAEMIRGALALASAEAIE